MPGPLQACRGRRNCIDLETHQAVFDWVLKRLTEHGLLKGQMLGIDASTLEADAALKSIVRRDTGQSDRDFLIELAKAAGIETADRRATGEVRSKAEGQKRQQR